MKIHYKFIRSLLTYTIVILVSPFNPSIHPKKNYYFFSVFIRLNLCKIVYKNSCQI